MGGDLTFRPFRAADIDRIDFRAAERRILDAAGDPVAYAHMLETRSFYATTACLDGLPIGCAGILGRHGGVGEGWALLGADFPAGRPTRAWAAATREVRRVLRRAVEADFHRIEVNVRGDFPAAKRWIERLGGFVFEGPKIAYGPDMADYLGYARISHRVFFDENPQKKGVFEPQLTEAAE